MLVKTKAIVLQTLKYNEKSLIVKCFTQTDGMKTYFVPSAYASKKKQQKIAYFQPLNILEIEANHKNKGTLEHFKEIKLALPFYTISSDVIKSTIILFLSEVLAAAIREEEQNEALFEFIEVAMEWLDTHESVANFHLVFLVEITKYLGVFPDNSEDHFDFFDVKQGQFVSQQSLESLPAYESLLFKNLLKLRFDSPKNIFNYQDRQALLKVLLDYYAYHLDGFRRPKSLDVLKEVFEML